MTRSSPRRELATARLPYWRSTGRILAALAALAALFEGAYRWQGGRAVLLWQPQAMLGIVAVAAAVLAHSWVHGWTPRERWLRRLGYTAAAAAVLVGLAAPMPRITAACLVAMGLSLALKPRVLPLAVVGDVGVFFVCATQALAYLYGEGVSGARMAPATAVALAALAAAWMMVWPEMRPTAYFLERGSAGALMRWLLPLTLLYPLVLGVVPILRDTHHARAAQAATSAVVFGTVLFGAMLLWLISRQLDGRDFSTLAASAEMRASEERYRLLFEASPLPMWIFDAETLRYLAVNESAIRRYGYTRKEFLRMTALDLRPPEEHDALRAALSKSDRADGRRWVHVTKSGERLAVEVFAHEIEWNGRRANLSYIRDITERLEYERQLQESEAQVRTLLESTSEGIFATDLEARCIWCNPATVQQLGYESAEQILGQNMHRLAHHTRADGSPYPEAECAGKEAALKGVPYINDDELLWRADGTRLPVAMRSAPLRREGKAVGTVVTFVDTTERRKLQAQFQQAQKMEAVGRLAAGVAHDFNNLLTVVNGYAEMLLGKADLAAIHPKLTAIRRAGERGATLTRQLLSFSRMQMVEPRAMNLNEAVEEAGPLLRRLLGEGVRLEFELGEGLPAVRAEIVQIGQVLMNLVSNSKDAIAESGTVVVRTWASQDRAEVGLSVSDDGCGMDPATRDRIFEPFFTTKPQGQGTGLGLATVYGIVQQFGGRLSVTSEPDRGTTVTIHFPALAGEAPRPAAAAAQAAAAGGGGERVLVIEDEDTVRELACEVLAAAGFQVQSAALPSQALRMFEASPQAFDLLLTDVVMPEFNGRKLAARILERRPDLPVIYMSGYADNALGGQGILDEGLAFIAKPFNPSDLVRKVREVLMRTAGAASA